MTTPIDYEKYMPRGYTLLRTNEWAITDPAIGTNIPLGTDGPVDIYVTWEGETRMALVLINSAGERRTLVTGQKSIRYTLGARAGDLLTVTAVTVGFPAADSNLRGTLKILPTATP